MRVKHGARMDGMLKALKNSSPVAIFNIEKKHTGTTWDEKIIEMVYSKD